jgi:HlyD family secretion protein
MMHDENEILTATPIDSASSQPSLPENRFNKAEGALVMTTANQQSQSAQLLTADLEPVGSQSPSKPPWWRRKWLKFALAPILFVMFGPVSSRVLESLPIGRSTDKPLTQAVERKTVPLAISANGTVKAYRSINLSPKTAGIIKSLLVKEGDRVKQGQVVAVMDDSSLRGEIDQFQGQLLQQQANLQRLTAGNRPQDIAKAEAQLAEVQANLRQLQAGNRPQDIAKAEAQLAEVQANLQQLQAGNRPQEIAQAAAKLQQAQATLNQRAGDWQRYQQLYKSGAISGQTLEQKRTDRDVAQNQVLEAKQVLALQQAGTRPEQIAQAQAKVAQQAQAVALLKAGARPEEIAQAQAKVAQQAQAVALLKAGIRPEEIAQARAQVQAAQGALKTVRDRVAETKILAPFDGIVLEKYADVGAFVSPSMVGGGSASASSSSILMLTSDRQQVVVNIAESQIAKVKLGQAVTIEADAFPGEKFTGRVEQIAPQAKVAQNVTSVEVRVSLAPAAKKLATGMNVESQFAVGQSANALFVPNAAVVKQSQGSGVYVFGSDGKSVFQPIQTGMTSGKQTEVKSGLQGGERILLSPPTEKPAGGGLKFPPAPP